LSLGDGSLTELHPYGAQIFARYLSEQVADSSLIRDVWVNGEAQETPIDAIRRELLARGEDFDDVFVSFASHNAVLDYERADIYADTIRNYRGFYPGEDHRIVGSLSIVSEDGFLQTDEDTFPGGYAYNVIDLSGIDGDAVTVQFVGDEVGSFARTSSFRLSLVAQSSDSIKYIPVELQSNQVNTTIEGLGEHEKLFLVITSQPEEFGAKEVFGYQVRAFVPPVFQGGSCSVSTQSNHGVWLLFLGLVGFLRGRRKVK
jgi:hypothetical protein